MATPPVFILSCSRSGSTLLRYIMDTHPNVFCPPELHLCRVISPLQHVHRELLQSKKSMSGSQGELSVNQAVQKQLNQMMNLAAKSEGKQIWCEKSIHSASHLPLIQAVFPNALYVCLYRHCLDQMDSLHERLEEYPGGEEFGCSEYLKNTGFDKVNGLADYWYTITTAMRRFQKANSKQCFELKYEDLVNNPESNTKRLFKFLGLKCPPNLIENVFKEKRDRGAGDHKIKTTNSILDSSVNKQLSFDSAQLSENRVSNLNALLAELDYTPLPGTLARNFG